ncbi:hypothetical protein NHP21011_14570 [Helicobacter heilmannii]|uniref:hypothetical protein n=1 Tax=Helicobacter heilmannii TaxID=35817 RepID=UPI00244D896D|nr:hypothetical protein [Helicobacter heilmannii]GMB95353.1 hypothetical protein NHP21011_14570 [Helicobacter heilmannii]
MRGHIDEFGNTHINRHIHFEFVTLDENTGKSMFYKGLITNAVLGQMQKEVANILNMQRGVEKRISGAKCIEPRAYAQLWRKKKPSELN